MNMSTHKYHDIPRGSNPNKWLSPKSLRVRIEYSGYMYTQRCHNRRKPYKYDIHSYPWVSDDVGTMRVQDHSEGMLRKGGEQYMVYDIQYGIDKIRIHFDPLTTTPHRQPQIYHILRFNEVQFIFMRVSSILYTVPRKVFFFTICFLISIIFIVFRNIPVHTNRMFFCSLHNSM